MLAFALEQRSWAQVPVCDDNPDNPDVAKCPATLAKKAVDLEAIQILPIVQKAKDMSQQDCDCIASTTKSCVEDPRWKCDLLVPNTKDYNTTLENVVYFTGIHDQVSLPASSEVGADSAASFNPLPEAGPSSTAIPEFSSATQSTQAPAAFQEAAFGNWNTTTPMQPLVPPTPTASSEDSTLPASASTTASAAAAAEICAQSPDSYLCKSDPGATLDELKANFKEAYEKGALGGPGEKGLPAGETLQSALAGFDKTKLLLTSTLSNSKVALSSDKGSAIRAFYNGKIKNILITNGLQIMDADKNKPLTLWQRATRRVHGNNLERLQIFSKLEMLRKKSLKNSASKKSDKHST